MSLKLRLDNFADSNIIQRTYLDADAALNAALLTGRNPSGFNVNAWMVVGALGDESSQLVRITSVAGDDLGITPGLLQPHVRYEDLTILLGNELKIYRALAPSDDSLPADSAYSVVGVVAIEPDSNTTDFTDGTGSDAYYYKFTYFNSLTNSETDLSTSVASRAAAPDGVGRNHYTTVEDIRFEAGFQRNPNITDTKIAEQRDEAENIINSTLQGLYDLPFKEPVPAIITLIAKKMAAGLLLQAEYRPVVTGSVSPGDDKVTEANALLQQVLNRKINLVDAKMQPMSLTTGVSSWPDETTAATEGDEAGGDHMFRVSDIY